VTEGNRESLATQRPEETGGDHPDGEERESERTEAVRQPDGGRPWEGDHVHERGDCPADGREHQTEEQGEIGRQFRGHGRHVWSDRGKSRRSATRTPRFEVVAVSRGGPRSNDDRGSSRAGRAQANLAALAAALFALTAVTVLGVAAANGALVGEFRDADERHAATTVADRIVADASPVTNRSNVLDRGAIEAFDAAALRRDYPILDGRSVRVTVGRRVVVTAGTPSGGTTRRRLVLVERRRNETVTPSFSGPNRVTLPRRAPWAELDIGPPDNVSVSAVRANDRVVLRDPSGLDGRYTVSVSRRETVQFTFVANSSLDRGDVTLTFAPSNTTKTRLGVTVDD